VFVLFYIGIVYYKIQQINYINTLPNKYYIVQFTKIIKIIKTNSPQVLTGLQQAKISQVVHIWGKGLGGVHYRCPLSDL